MRQFWSDLEIATLRKAYACPDGFSRAELAIAIGRTEQAIACKAGHLGITNEPGRYVRTAKIRQSYSSAQRARFSTPEARERMRAIATEFHRDNEHPRGMLGKHHSQLSKDAISAFHSGKKSPPERVLRQMKTRVARYGSLAPANKRGSWKAEWIECGGKRLFARSRWEANYARYLQFLKKQGAIREWEHEPETFWFEKIKRGVRSYLPDFRVTNKDGSIEYHEVKGWMDDRSKTKIKRMRIYHPLVLLIIRDSAWFKANTKKLCGLVRGWAK